MKHVIARRDLMRFVVGQAFYVCVDRPEILVTGLQQGIETVDDEIGLLEIVDNVFRCTSGAPRRSQYGWDRRLPARTQSPAL